MTAKKHIGFLSVFCLLAILMLIGCGSDDKTFDPNAIPPSITGLNRNSADIGDEVVITGLRFGHSRSESIVSLNGVPFQVNEFKMSNDVPPVQVPQWTDTQVTVVVSEGMTSGIVVVTVEGVDSQSGSKAQLFIPNPPGDSVPLIGGISPNYGREGTTPDSDPASDSEFAADDQVLITGFNFGDGSGESGVYFPAPGAAVSQVSGNVKAPVVKVLIGETMVSQWTNSSIKVTIPSGSESGLVYVVVANGDRSINEIPFTVLPKQLSGPPLIFPQENTPPGLFPNTGGTGTPVAVSGENFGRKQGSSSIKINDLPMDVITWSDGEIVAELPAGAVSGPIRVTVGPAFAESDIFLVANRPFISGLIPSAMRVGKPLTVVGQFFGSTDTPGTLKVGNTTVPVLAGDWSETQILVPSLPVLSYSDPTNVAVTVTAVSGLSDTVSGSVESPLSVFFLPPNPSQGEAGVTTFELYVTVIGGSGSYSYTLIPDKTDGSPPVMDTPVTTLPMTHKYPIAKVTKITEFETRIKVRDDVTKDEIIVDGPTLTVVPEGQGVITSIELLNFNNGSTPSIKGNPFARHSFEDPPDSGDYTHVYYDFTFDGSNTYYGSGVSEFDGGSGPITGVTRDLSAFMSGTGTARPYGYRYQSTEGSVVRINGLNLGIGGDIYLNSTGTDVGELGFHVEAVNILPSSWTNESIDFYLPKDAIGNLSGKVAIVTPITSVLSQADLICSAYRSSAISPVQPIAMDLKFQVSAYDLEPPVVQDVTGLDTYMIFYVQATYTDPFTDLPDDGPALLATPLPCDPSGTQVTFDLLDVPASAPVEVFNGDLSQARYTDGTIDAGEWQAFIWTGVLDDGSDYVRANSGIFSESFSLTTKDGSGPPGETYSISGLVYDNSFPSNPLPGITVKIQSITGPVFEDQTVSSAVGFYSFTGLPENEQYEVWAEGGPWVWPGHRPVPNTGVLTQDETMINISANFTGP